VNTNRSNSFSHKTLVWTKRTNTIAYRFILRNSCMIDHNAQIFGDFALRDHLSFSRNTDRKLERWRSSVYGDEVDIDDHHGHCSLGDQYCAAMSGAGWPGTAIGTLTPGDIRPAREFIVFCLILWMWKNFIWELHASFLKKFNFIVDLVS